jgi:hypothetical protein
VTWPGEKLFAALTMLALAGNWLITWTDETEFSVLETLIEYVTVPPNDTRTGDAVTLRLSAALLCGTRAQSKAKTKILDANKKLFKRRDD